MTLLRTIYRRGTRSRRVSRLLASGALAAVCLSLGCAHDVPTQATLSGRYIHVVMRFASPPEPNFYYYFLINKYGPMGSQNDTHGPVPVIGPVANSNNGFGNGFATSAVQNTTGTIAGLPDYGITDFVLYHNPQRQNFGLYHFSTDPNTQQDPGNASLPYRFIPPLDVSTGDDLGSRTIEFYLDMSQLANDATTTQARIAEGKATQYLQVNIVATNIRPTDPTTNVNKEVDSMGNTLDPTAQNSFLQIDLTQSRTYTSEDNVSSLNEPSSNDVYPGGSGNSALNLEYWKIDVQP